jgi:TonB family protein
MSEEAISKKILIAGEQDSRRTLLLGFGCSVFVHAFTALVVSQLWHPAEEIMEITLVEPVEEPPQPPPAVAVKPTPLPRPSVPIKVAVVNSPSPALTPTPTLPPSVRPTPLRSRPIEVAKKTTPIPTPQPTPNLPRPIPTQPEQVVTRKRQEDEKETIAADLTNGKSGGSMGATNQGALAASTTQPNRGALNPAPDRQSGKENPSGGESDDRQPQESEMGGEPGNIARIAGSSGGTPAGSNQSGIGNSGSRSDSIGATIAGAGDRLSPGEESSTGSSGEPGNIASIAGSSNGGTPTGSNQGGIGNSRSRSNSIGATIAGTGDGLSPGEESSTGGSGEPGNIAGIGNGVTPTGSNQGGIGNSGSRSNGIGVTIAGAGSGLSPGDDAFSDGSHSPGRGGNIASGGNSDLAGNNQGGLGVGRSRASSLAEALSTAGNRDGLDSDNLASFSPGDTKKIARGNTTLAPENSGKPPPRCIKNCNITDIKIGASDSGKDKIIIKAKIDGNGIVLTANIYRSSGNRDLDRLILKATQKMEFSPTGTTDVYNIKHNLYSSAD